MDEANLNYVIRLNTKKSRVKLKDSDREEIPDLALSKGEKRHIRGAYYRGEVEVNVAGVWREGYREPLWVMGTLAPEEFLETYDERMQLEHSFKDTKSLLNLEKVMNKERNQLEMTLASLVLLAYVLGLSIGEEARDEAYYRGGGEKIPSERPDEKEGLLPLL